MTDDWKIQHSFKIGDDLTNVRGDDADEFVKNLIALTDPQTTALVHQVRAALRAAPVSTAQAVQTATRARPQSQQIPPGHVGQAEVQHQWQGQQVQQQQAAATSGFKPETCNHGEMKFFAEGKFPGPTNPNGEWWACIAQKGDPSQCKPRKAAAA